jgi:hypothetical protein
MRSMTRRAAGALLAALLFVGWVAHSATAQTGTVRLVVDYGDGAMKVITDLAWSKGNTVLDVMKAAQAHVHGISFSYTGSGASAFLTKIDDVQNEGGGTGKKNWQLWVNTSYADKGFAALEVQPSDVVFWRFATQQGK